VLSECHECLPTLLGTISKVSESVNVSTRWAYQLTAQDSLPCIADSKGPHKSYQFGEHGTYNITVTGKHAARAIQIVEIVPPCETYLAFIVTTCVFAGLALLYLALSQLRRYCNESQRRANEEARARNLSVPSTTYPSISHHLGCFPNLDEESPSFGQHRFTELATQSKITNPAANRVRLHSLDTFRGISLAVMLIANDSGGMYWFLDHSAWNGLTVADLVFPWFCWIMGTSMVFAFRSRKFRELRKPQQFYRVSRRAVILFCIGLFDNMVQGDTALTHLRIPGVLQYLAVAYWATAMISLFVPTWGVYTSEELDAHERHPTAENIPEISPPWYDLYLRDLYPYVWQWLIVLALLVSHVCISKYLPIWDGCPTGYLGPGGHADWGRFYNCTGGASSWIDEQVFGVNHIYTGGTFQDPELYSATAMPHDPEGLLGMLTAIVLCYLGHHAGRVIVAYQTADGSSRVTVRWMVWAVILGAAAGGLCGFTQNDGWLPVTKNLWSASFILALASGAFFSLSLLHLLVDRFALWSGAPFRYLGMNSILVYVGSQYFTKFPFGFPHAKTHGGYCASTAMLVSSWLMVAYFCFANDFFCSI